MVARVFNGIRNFNLNEFRESGSEPNTNFYLFIGKSTPWTNDAIPETPTQRLSEFYTTWSEMIGLKKILPINMRPIIRRINWTSGNVYIAWDSNDENMFAKDFYVMNSNFNVYKCLWNNNGALSTVEPTGTGTTNITTGDGYIWKYLYTISTGDANVFLSSTWMPVNTDSAVAAAAIDGALDRIRIINPGSGYTTTPTVTITSNTGTGATATAVLSGGSISNIILNTRGQNYRDVTISITGGGGTGATATSSVAPYGGHGLNPEKELGCTHLMIVTDLIGNELPVDISFRKVGVLLNPRDTSGALATANTYNTPLTDLQRGSGDLFYIEHRIPVNRTNDSTENFKFALRF